MQPACDPFKARPAGSFHRARLAVAAPVRGVVRLPRARRGALGRGIRLRARGATVITHWRTIYSHRRPHSSLGWRLPAAYAASLSTKKSEKPARLSQRPDLQTRAGQWLSARRTMDPPASPSTRWPRCRYKRAFLTTCVLAGGVATHEEHLTQPQGGAAGPARRDLRLRAVRAGAGYPRLGACLGWRPTQSP
jgi:hypothetical protein